MGSTICTAGFPSAAIASSCFTARCDSIWYGFFIATLLFLGKRNCSQPIKGFERGSRYFLRSTGHSPYRKSDETETINWEEYIGFKVDELDRVQYEYKGEPLMDAVAAALIVLTPLIDPRFRPPDL